MTDKDFENLKVLTNAIGRKLTKSELRTVEIRKSVTHGDYEIILHGRIFPGKFANLDAVIRAGTVEDRVDSILERLRGRRFHYVTHDYQYGLFDVTKEINYVLSSILSLSLTETEQNLIRKDIELRENEIFGQVFPKDKETCESLRFSNSVLAEKLVKLTRRK